MLSEAHTQAYQEFLSLLIKFKESFQEDNFDFDSEVIKLSFQQLQWCFERKIVVLDAEKIAAAIVPRWQAIQRELIREFRLLATDMIFWAAARQTATKETRLKSIASHLDKLSDFCQLVVKL